MSTHQSPDARVRDAVSRADRQRRSRLAMQALARITPIAAVVALIVALSGRFLGWPLAVSVAVLALMAGGLVLFALYHGRSREISDPVALSIDADANLNGELRSAHWFATTGGGDDWSAYHVEQAANRVGQVDWSALYPPVRAMKSWAASAVLAILAMAIAVEIPGIGPKFQGAAAGPEAELAAKLAGEEIPEELRKKIEEMLANMTADQMNAKEMDAKMANIKELMDQLDPAMQKKLAELLKKQPLGENAETKRRDLDEEDKAERAERGENSQAGLPEDVRWGLEDLAARLASANLDRKSNENNPSASSETGEMGKGSQQAEMQAGGQQQMQLMREAAKEAGAQMMAGGAGMMGGDSQAGAGGNSGQKSGQADVKSIAEALRRELVEASADARGENVPIEDIRRKTEAGRSSLGFSKVAPLATFDRSRTAAPPAVPVARHPLLYNYFTRKK